MRVGLSPMSSPMACCDFPSLAASRVSIPKCRGSSPSGASRSLNVRAMWKPSWTSRNPKSSSPPRPGLAPRESVIALRLSH